MALQLTIPDSVLNHMHLPSQKIKPELQKQLAIALYSNGTISFEAACELAELDCWTFGNLVNEKDLAQRCSRFETSGEVIYRCSE